MDADLIGRRSAHLNAVRRAYVDSSVRGDAADYVVWRKTAAQSGTGLAADVSGPGGAPDGVVDDYDFACWTANFGNMLSGAVSSTGMDGIVPQPATCCLAVVASLV
jgi:hypothetical protein